MRTHKRQKQSLNGKSILRENFANKTCEWRKKKVPSIESCFKMTAVNDNLVCKGT